MAQTVHLRLVIDGTDIVGESEATTLDREGTIECSSFTWGVVAPYDPSSLRLTGRRIHEQVTIIKKVDQTTPLLIRALCNNDEINEAEFMFFRPSIRSSGSEEKFYTVKLERGHIASVNQISEDVIIAGDEAPPMMEEVSFIFGEITWTYEENGATHHDRVV